jgi:RNA polymerase primary sigma factor
LRPALSVGVDVILKTLVEDKMAISPQNPVFSSDLREATGSAPQCLSSREQEIVLIRFGLNETEKEYFLKEWGDRFEVTRERIRQIEEGALRKLRQPGNSGNLQD